VEFNYSARLDSGKGGAYSLEEIIKTALDVISIGAENRLKVTQSEPEY
jgi:hypothetical protein